MANFSFGTLKQNMYLMNLPFFSVLIFVFVLVNGYHSQSESLSNLSGSTSRPSHDAPLYSNTDCMCPHPCDQGYRGSRPQCMSSLEKLKHFFFPPYRMTYQQGGYFYPGVCSICGIRRHS
ncbi:hypothetical protein GEMRC1_009454 [Eukaryota sp. GEM-RC1]